MDKLLAVFKQKGFTPKQPCLVRQTISVSEKGQTYVLECPEPKKSAVYQVDGYMITAGDKCDAFVAVDAGRQNKSSKGAVVQIFVELKGKNVSHGIKQLRQTITHSLFSSVKPMAVNPRYARLIPKSIPASAAKDIVEKARIEFRKKYNVVLTTLKSKQPDRLPQKKD
ncbi:MAG: hypothetical protein ACI4V2_04405 [Alloprevotella sp.]